MYDLVVLGKGSGGRLVAEAAARVGAKVALVVPDHRDGRPAVCPSVLTQALVEAARRVERVRSAGSLGIRTGSLDVDFSAVMARARTIGDELAAAESDESLRARGIEVLHGSPAFEAYDTIVLDGRRRVSAHRFVIATGSRTAVPGIPGLAEAGYLDNQSLWSLNERPSSLAVLGAGPVAIELAQALARLGSEVTVLADAARILPQEEAEISAVVQQALAAEGIRLETGVEMSHVTTRDGMKLCHYRKRSHAGSAAELAVAQILVAGNEVPNIEGLNLEAAGIHADSSHGIEVDDYLQTRSQRIYAIGAVTHRDRSTQAAERDAALVFQNAVLRLARKVSHTARPRVTWTDPEVASVGLHESDAREQHPGIRVYRTELTALPRAQVAGRPVGFAKVVATPSGKVLGASVVGDEAALILQEFVVAMEHGLTLSDLAATIHPEMSYSGAVSGLASQFAASRLGGPLVQTALRWFLGLRIPGEGGAPASEAETHVANENAAEASAHANGHGHGHH